MNAQHSALVARAVIDAFPRPPDLLVGTVVGDRDAAAVAYLDPDVQGVLFVPRRDLLRPAPVRVLVPVWRGEVVRSVVRDAIETMDVSSSASWCKFATSALAEDPNLKVICAHVSSHCAWPLVTCDAAARVGVSYARAYRASHLARVRDSVVADGEGYGTAGREARPVHDLDLAEVCTPRRLSAILERWSEGGGDLDFDEVVLALMTVIFFNPERPDNLCLRARRRHAPPGGDAGKSHSLRRVGDGLHMSPVDLGFVTTGPQRLEAPTTLQDIADTVLEKVMWELRGPERRAEQASLAAEAILAGGRECARRRRAAKVVDRYLFEVLPRLSARDAHEYRGLQSRVACYAFHLMMVTRDVPAAR